MKAKRGKVRRKTASYRLTDAAREEIARRASVLGISQAAAIELLVRGQLSVGRLSGSRDAQSRAEKHSDE